MLVYIIHDEDLYHKEASPLICSANEWTGLYMRGTCAMKELMKKVQLVISFFVAADKLNTFNLLKKNTIKPKANNGLMLCCKLWVILAHW